MRKSNDPVFEEYKDLYKLTGKTADEHIEFYKKKESLSEEDLFTIWKKLSQQVENFDEKDWTENWHNWHKNFHAFEKHKFEAKFLIQHYLTDVLEELVKRLVGKYEEHVKLLHERIKPRQKVPDDYLSNLIKTEIKRQIKEEFANQKQKMRKK